MPGTRRNTPQPQKQSFFGKLKPLAQSGSRSDKHGFSERQSRSDHRVSNPTSQRGHSTPRASACTLDHARALSTNRRAQSVEGSRVSGRSKKDAPKEGGGFFGKLRRSKGEARWDYRWLVVIEVIEVIEVTEVGKTIRFCIYGALLA